MIQLHTFTHHLTFSTLPTSLLDPSPPLTLFARLSPSLSLSLSLSLSPSLSLSLSLAFSLSLSSLVRVVALHCCGLASFYSKVISPSSTVIKNSVSDCTTPHLPEHTTPHHTSLSTPHHTTPP